MAAGQRDIPVLLQPGGGATVRAPGAFLYLKFADREIQAVITGEDGTQSRVKMVTGDFSRPGGGISEVELVNPDPANACAVVVTIGDGEFDRKIIQGEVTITPGIRGADGQFVDDTRSTLRLRAAIGNINARSFIVGDVVRSESFGEEGFLQPTWLAGERLLVHALQNGSEGEYRLLSGIGSDSVSVSQPALVGQGPGVMVGAELWLPAQISVVGVETVVYEVYDAATLKYRRRVITDIPPRTGGGGPKLDAVDYHAGYLYQGRGGDVFKIGVDGRVAASAVYGVSQPGAPEVGVVVVRNGRVHVSRSSNTWTSSLEVYDATSFQQLPASASEIPELASLGLGFCMDRERGWLIQGVDLSFSDSSGFDYIALRDVTISATGSVTSCAGGGFMKQAQVDTRAELYTQRLDDGRVLMSGELLRAVLEIYTGRYMPENYLDYIYRVRAENLNGISPRTIDSGGKSFLAAGIPDDASGVFPQTVEITIREGLL